MKRHESARSAGSLEIDRVVLVGFMGAGKTTVGAALARLLGWGFRDMDGEIEAQTGQSVAEIFSRRGEAFFREEERRAALSLGELHRAVVAAGGGAFVAPETREALRKGSVVVWLRADLDTLLSRIPPDGSRPLAENRERMARLFAERESSYRQADVTVDASGAGPEEVARRIAAAVFPNGAPGGVEDVEG